ncbi:MAG: ATP-binding protein [Tissierellia bacterium]|nr:ATP-binding protein [Tissierellia bacterium]
MIDKLRRKFVALTVISVSIVLAVIIGILLYSSYTEIDRRADELLNTLMDNDGVFPTLEMKLEKPDLSQRISQEAPFSTRYFTGIFDEDYKLRAIAMDNINSIDESVAKEYLNVALESDTNNAYIDEFKYQITKKEYGTLVVFIDAGRDLYLFQELVKSSLSIAVLTIVAVMTIAWALSNKAIAPIIESYEKQKQFITDASHELKTPIAIIQTNTEVLELEYGESNWSKSIQNQVVRLRDLVDSLITLTRMDEGGEGLMKTDFSISDAIAEAIKPFETSAENAGKTIQRDLEKNLSYYGNEESIRRLLGILLDNAIKYAPEGTIINISLKSQGKKRLLLVTNAVDGIARGRHPELFERFYRLDVSRNSSSGGYGIGLSIAKLIVQQHRGVIVADSPDGKSLDIQVIL